MSGERADREDDQGFAGALGDAAFQYFRARGIPTTFDESVDAASSGAPDLQALAGTLLAVVESGESQRFGAAVLLLQDVHRLSPSTDGAREYFDLLVDMKTKAVLFSLLSGESQSREQKRALLDYYFDPQLCASLADQETLQDCPSLEEYSAALHTFARIGCENLLEESRQFLQQSLLSPSTAGLLHDNLVHQTRTYLTTLRLSSPELTLVQWCRTGEMAAKGRSQEGGKKTLKGLPLAHSSRPGQQCCSVPLREFCIPLKMITLDSHLEAQPRPREAQPRPREAQPRPREAQPRPREAQPRPREAAVDCTGGEVEQSLQGGVAAVDCTGGEVEQSLQGGVAAVDCTGGAVEQSLPFSQYEYSALQRAARGEPERGGKPE